MTRATLGLVVACGTLFIGAFSGTVITRSQVATQDRPRHGPPLARWLGLDDETTKLIEAHDPSFQDELAALRKRRDDARAALAVLFDRTNSSDEEIRKQTERVIEAQNAIERRTIDYLLAVRDHLTPEQQKKLFDLCAENVRAAHGRQWRGGRGPSGDETGDSHGRRGRGGRHGRGGQNDRGGNSSDD